MASLIFVTGGVVSSLGKGIASASLASILEARGLRVTLLKPMTWMNESGRAVGEAMRWLKLKPAQVVVFYDELDIAPGTVMVHKRNLFAKLGISSQYELFSQFIDALSQEG